MQNVRTLKPVQISAIRMLALGTPANLVAERLEISAMTIWRWRKNPAFETRLNAITSSGLEEIAKHLNSAALAAVETIDEILCDLTQPAPIRLKAALGLLNTMASVNNALEKGLQHRVADFDMAQRFGRVTYDHGGGEPCPTTEESTIML